MKIYESKYDDLWTASEMDQEKHVVISIVGAGGKTSLIQHFSNILNLNKIHHFIATTTHMWPMTVGSFGQQMGRVGNDGKVMPPDEHEWQQIFSRNVPVLIEADGSKGLPCKAPEEWEPVLRKETTHVFAVLGVSCLGERIKDVCHRPKRVQHILSCDENYRLTEEDLMTLMTCKEGLRKGVSDAWKFYGILNQVDDEACYERLRFIKDRIREKDIENVFFTRLK